MGGVLTIFFLGINLNVPAAIGFTTLFGIAVDNGILLVVFADQLRGERGRRVVNRLPVSRPSATLQVAELIKAGRLSGE